MRSIPALPKVAVALASAFLSLAGVDHSTAFAEPKTITLLDRGEPREALVFHDNVLWVGKNRSQFNAHYSLEVYGRDDRLIGTASFNHSLNYISPYGPHSVIVVGTGTTPNLTHYSIVTLGAGGVLTVDDRTIALGGWADTWIGTLGGREYFTDMGGNPEDQAPIGVPAQTIFSVGPTRQARYLPLRLRMPLKGVTLGNEAFVLRGEAIGDSRTNIAVFKTSDQSPVDLFSPSRNNIRDILSLTQLGVIALAEKGAGQVLILDPQSRRLTAEIPTGSSPRSLASFGRCVVVADEYDRQIAIVDVSSAAVLSKFDLGVDEHVFKRLMKVAVDPQSGRIYARSNYACNPTTEACNEDWNRILAFEHPGIREACLAGVNP